MKDFRMLITDDRWAVPTAHLLQVANETRARELAKQKLAENPHHVGVELYDGDALLFALGDVSRSRNGQAPPQQSMAPESAQS